MGTKKVVVVGAGPGGLTNAMILAHRGFDVTVLEKGDSVGGRNSSIKLNGYIFDKGPTFLMMNFILNDMFHEVDREVDDYLITTKLEPMYRLKFSDLEFFPTGDKVQMEKQIVECFPGNDKGYEKFLRSERNRFERIFPCLQKPYLRIPDYLSIDFLRAVPYLSLGRSMFGMLGDYFDQDKLKLSFTFQSKYLGMSAWECPAFFTMVPFVEHEYGIYHVQGGLNAISLAMEKVLEEQGVHVRKHATVRKFLVNDRSIKGVELGSGEMVTADDFVINADFSYAMTNLFRQEDLRKYKKERFARMRYSCSTFMLYLGINHVYPIPHHNIFFARDYKTNVEDIFTNMKLSPENSFYIQNASVSDSTLAPKGKSTIYILVPVPHNRSGINWDAEKDNFREHILSQVESRSEMSDLRQHIEVEKMITPSDWERDENVYLGATFNMGHNISQMLYFRPHNQFEELNNCYLVGGGTHPGSGLPTIYESGRISANLISKKYGVAFKPPSPLSSKIPSA